MIASLLIQANGLLTATVLIVAFSLLTYIALHNWRNSVARALCVLLASVVIVYGGDVLLGRANRPATMQFLLRAQWLGIALVPAAYLHFANAMRWLHRSPNEIATNPLSHQERRRVWFGYLGSMIFFLLALHTDLVVRGGISGDLLSQFQAGPIFWVYVVFFSASLVVTFKVIIRAQHRALTPTLRRRLSYLQATFVAPGLGVFPYLVLAGNDLPLSSNTVLLLSALVSIGVMIMLTVMTYSIGFQGVLMPDRLIKQDFIRWFLYGPMVGVTIILCIQIVPWLDSLLGLPSDTLITFVVMMMTVLMPIFISRVRPYLDALVYMQDQDEIDYLRGLPRNVFTRTDLRQLLENTLIAVCGAMQAETGFVAGPSKEGYTVKAVCGSRREVKQFVADHPLSDLVEELEQIAPHDRDGESSGDVFVSCGAFRLLPLRSKNNGLFGVLGIVAPPGTDAVLSNESLMPESRHLIDVLTHHMELAMTTVQMQQRILENLRNLGPEMESLQQLTKQLDQVTPDSLASIDTDISLHPQFPQLVKDALTHYWGGPKLSDSPLLKLRTVRLLQEQEPSPTRALQAVLRQAITNLRPADQLDPSAQEWLLYNILELRFLQGKRIRDVAHRLAMSESDFYRKQRIAVEEVARQLVLMEDSHKPH